MTLFMAGAIAIGASVARHSVVSRSGAPPPARRAMISAVAGAISTRSAHRASSMWLIDASASLSQRFLRIGRPETACSDVCVTNSSADAVMTICTSAPRSRSLRTSSGVL